jgi:hypothetical protein
MSSSLSDPRESAGFAFDDMDDTFDDFDDDFDEDFEEETAGEYEPATEYVGDWQPEDPDHLADESFDDSQT